MEKLHKYLDGELTNNEEKLKLEKEIILNHELAEKFRLLKQIDVLPLDEEAIEIRAKFEEIHRKHSVKMNIIDKIIILPINNKKTKVFISIAAVALLYMALLFVLRYNGKSLSNEQLYSMYFSPAATNNNFRGLTSDDNILNLGYNYYEKGDYETAINYFNKALLNDPNNLEVKQYLGLSYMNINDYNKAIEEFKYILDKKPNLFTEDSSWYLALCYLKINNISEAKKQFDLISRDPYNSYNKKAFKILKSL